MSGERYFVIQNKIRGDYVEYHEYYPESRQTEYGHTNDVKYARVYSIYSVVSASKKYCKNMGIKMSDIKLIEVDISQYYHNKRLAREINGTKKRWLSCIIARVTW